MSELVVRRVGVALVQDAGRPGQASIGVGRSGAADRAAYELANRMVGNAEGAAALEVVLGGLALEAVGTVWVCVTGAPAPLDVDGREEPTGVVLALRPGQRLRLGTPATGLRSYVAVRGGIEAPQVLGSRSRDTLGGLGPAPLAEGDRLDVGAAVSTELLVDSVPPVVLEPDPVLRVIRGPHDAWIADPEALVRTRWTVAAASDRVGTRLEGPPLTRIDPARQLPSQGAVRGTIQVPPDGRPVVLGPDHPATGGYPVIGVVVDKDTDRLAQLRPGETVGFVWV